MDPVAALNEIAYWLERDLASPFRTKAFRKAADVIAALPPADVAERAKDGALDQEPAMLDRVDIVVASVHSKLRMASAEMTGRMLRAVADPHTDVLGHLTGRLVEGSRGTRPESEFDAAAVFAACVEQDVAVELNSRPERQDPPDGLIRLALNAGCLFSIDSDAHAPGQLGFLEYGAARAAAAGIPPERIITTWPLDDLLAWAARH